MRLSTTILIVGAALTTVWAEAALPPTAGPSAAPPADTARDGLAARLAEAGAPPLQGMSLLIGPDGVWSVRGRALRGDGAAAGLPATLYAEAEPVCDLRRAEAACWRLTVLEIDGESVPVEREFR